MSVWSMLTRFVKSVFSNKEDADIDLIPSYLPMIPESQKEYYKSAHLTSMWASGYVQGIHNKLMNSGTGNEIVVVGAEYISGKPLGVKVVTSDNSDKVDEGLTKQLKEALRIDKFDKKNVKITELAGGGGVAAAKINIINGIPSVSVHSVDQFWIDFKNGVPERFNFFEEIPNANAYDKYFLVETREIKSWSNKTGKTAQGGFSTYSVCKVVGDDVKPIQEEALPDTIAKHIRENEIQLNKPISIGLSSLGAYLINNTPTNSRFTHLELGESDLSHSINFLFAVDYVFTIYMREGEKTKTKVAATERMFMKEKGKRGDKWSVNADEDYFMILKGSLDPGMTLKDTLQFIQGEFRDQSYRETMEYFAQKAVTKSGYNPNTFNLGNRDVKATEIYSLRDATMRKIDKKKQIIQNEYEALMWDFLYLLTDRKLDSNSRIIVEFPDPMSTNLSELSSTLNNMTSAQAMSVEEKVKMIHPKWDDKQVQEEVNRIYKENDIGEVPDPEAIGGAETRGG